MAELVESFDAFDVDDDAEDEQRLVFWFNDGDGGARQSRAVQLPTWNDVKSNYPGLTRRCLDSLMSLERPAGSAKLIVWYGEPGTGKTTAAAALSKSWAPWARTHVVTDPDRLFNDPAYLTHVIMSSPPRRTAGVDPWPLVICEDSGDYLCKSSARHSDGALGRLLGTTDGLMGRGLSFLVLLTMNESLAAIDPAVKRSGRCLATVEFGRFNKDDAAKWLGGAGELPPGGVTLAELYERRAEQSRIATPEVSVETGFYL